MQRAMLTTDNLMLSCLQGPASDASGFSASSGMTMLLLLNFKFRSVCLKRKLDYFLHICMFASAFCCQKHFLPEKEGVNKNRLSALEMSATASHHPMKSPLVSLLSSSWTSNSPIIPLTLEGQRYIKSIIHCVKAH